MEKKTIICIDRDGTLIYDDKYHLGKTNNWRGKVKILPGVIGGIKKLQKLPNTRVYMITNQPGVIIKDFKLLTDKQAHDVCKYIVSLLGKKGAHLDGYFFCAHASPAYVKKRSKYTFDKKKVCNCVCIKPRLGMVFNALKKEGIKRKDARVYVIGDRASDVQTGVNSKGQGVYVPFKGESSEINKVKKLKRKYGKKVFVGRSFLDAVRFVLKEEKR